MSAISLMRWLETNTARPSDARRLSSVRTHKMPSGSRPLMGSSKRSTPGSPSSAAAMPSRWVMPKRELPGPLARHGGQSHELEQLVDAGGGDGIGLGQGPQMVVGAAAGVDGLGLEEPAHLAQGPRQVVVAAALRP